MVAKHGGAAGGITKKGWEEAERLFRKAIEIDPQLAHFYLIDLGFAPSVEAGSSKMVEATEKAVQQASQ